MKINHREYIKALLKTVNVQAIKKQNFRILFDPVNGSAIETGKMLFSQLGTVLMINDQVGQKPPRPSEPRAATLVQTAQVVVKNHCDLGIALDVDADRVLFIDETGTVLSEDLTAVILAQGKKTLVTPVNSSGLFKAECQKWGATVIDCPVGPPEIIAAIKQHRADFAYEESGKYFFADLPAGKAGCCLWADGLLTGVRMLAAMTDQNLPLSAIRRQYPIFHQVKLAIKCPWEKMPQKFIGGGVKFEFPDNSFLFIRASGTEPLIRVFSDSPRRSRAAGLARKGKKMVTEILSV